MKKFLASIVLSILSYCGNAQKIERIEKREYNGEGNLVKSETKITGTVGETVNLRSVTFGPGMD